jgi:hypothetical protein
VLSPGQAGPPQVRFSGKSRTRHDFPVATQIPRVAGFAVQGMSRPITDGEFEMFRFASVVPAMALALSFATTAAAQTEPLRFQNNSSYVILRIFASPVTNSSWEDDLLGSNVLNPGQFLDVTFRNVSECNYDILIEAENGVQITDVVNICAVGEYTINN